MLVMIRFMIPFCDDLVPGTCLSSICGIQPSKTWPKLQSKQGSSKGSRCVMISLTPKTALGIFWGSIRPTLRPRGHNFCGGDHVPMQTLPSSNTTPTQKARKTSNNPTKKHNTNSKLEKKNRARKIHIPFKSNCVPKVLREYNKERHKCSCQLIHRYNFNSKGFATIVQDLLSVRIMEVSPRWAVGTGADRYTWGY